MLRQQLEEQKKAYNELRRKVEMLQSAQDDPSRSTGGSGYAEFVQLREIEAPGKLEREAENESTIEPEKVDLQKQIRDQVLQEKEAGFTLKWRAAGGQRSNAVCLSDSHRNGELA